MNLSDSLEENYVCVVEVLESNEIVKTTIFVDHQLYSSEDIITFTINIETFIELATVLKEITFVFSNDTEYSVKLITLILL